MKVQRNTHEGFLANGITGTDASISSANIEQLYPLIVENDRSLIFFIGAGASIAGNTGMPSTQSLLNHLLSQGLSFSGKFSHGRDNILSILNEITSPPHFIGFETTLNDFWQICRQATVHVYEAFADLESRCIPNRVHIFLAHWLATGGVVITTNYDRLIEREWSKMITSIKTQYREEGANSFTGWRNDLHKGGSLFKLHGSLDDPNSCLGALEHVGTQLYGNRSELLTEIVQTRPICFVGWQGADPDIPALLHSLYRERDPNLPTFWMHYEGESQGLKSLQKIIEESPPYIKSYANKQPILTEADRAFGEMLNWLGKSVPANPKRQIESFDFTQAIANCTKSGITRMVGISLRRAGSFTAAATVFNAAVELAESPSERFSVLQEISLLQQQIDGEETSHAIKSLEQAQETLMKESDLHLQLNADFGLLSMTIETLKSKPWLIAKIPGYFHRYREDIDSLNKKSADKESCALHQALLQLYLGQLRFKLWGWLAVHVDPLAKWVLRPFDVAHSTIANAKDIHVHSCIDILAYRAIALAHLGRCQQAMEQIPEISSLISVLNDNARTRHWTTQREDIEHRCV